MELHDGVGQLIIAAKLKLEAIEEKDDFENIKEIKQILDDIINEIRQISYDIMPSVLGEFGVIAAIESLCNKINETKKVKINFYCDEIPIINNQKIIYILYRIVQESINNIIRHSAATTAIIKISYLNKLLEIEISDNGKGFDVNNFVDNKGNGINNIKERVLLLNGKIDIFSDNNGTIIKIKIPITIL
jgi:signal transduction histidine kinase